MQIIDKQEDMKRTAKMFKAPEGYFDHLPGRIEKRAEAEAKRNQDFLPRAIAASFVLLLTAGMVLLLTYHPSYMDVSAMADPDSAAKIENVFISEFSLTETSLNPTIGIIDWDNLFNQSISDGASPHEIAEFIFEQEEFNF